MLRNAVLVIANRETGAFISIPVVNFPMLPEGSLVSLNLPEGPGLELVHIAHYSTCNKYGTQIHLSPDRIAGGKYDGEINESDWDEILALCLKDEAGGIDCWIYPHTLDYGVSYPMPSK